MVLFLDIDGVLNTPQLTERYGRDYICPTRTARVDTLCWQMRASVVLSTMWVVCDGYDQTVDALRSAGLNAPIIGHIHSVDGSRSEQIAQWVLAHKIDRFIALDDEPLTVPSILVSRRTGLTVEHVNRSIQMLGVIRSSHA